MPKGNKEEDEKSVNILIQGGGKYSRNLYTGHFIPVGMGAMALRIQKSKQVEIVSRRRPGDLGGKT